MMYAVLYNVIGMCVQNVLTIMTCGILLIIIKYINIASVYIMVELHILPLPCYVC